MNPVQIHVILSHVPVVGAIFVTLLLLTGLFRRSQELLRVGLCGLVLVALLAVPVFLSGDPSEEVVEKLPGVMESVIEPHEDFARVAFWLVVGLGALALVGLVRYGRRVVPKGFGVAILVLALVECATLVWAAHLGGDIRHTELRAGAAASADQEATHDE